MKIVIALLILAVVSEVAQETSAYRFRKKVKSWLKRPRVRDLLCRKWRRLLVFSKEIGLKDFIYHRLVWRYERFCEPVDNVFTTKSPVTRQTTTRTSTAFTTKALTTESHSQTTQTSTNGTSTTRLSTTSTSPSLHTGGSTTITTSVTDSTTTTSAPSSSRSSTTSSRSTDAHTTPTTSVTEPADDQTTKTSPQTDSPIDGGSGGNPNSHLTTMSPTCAVGGDDCPDPSEVSAFGVDFCNCNRECSPRKCCPSHQGGRRCEFVEEESRR